MGKTRKDAPKWKREKRIDKEPRHEFKPSKFEYAEELEDDFLIDENSVLNDSDD